MINGLLDNVFRFGKASDSLGHRMESYAANFLEKHGLKLLKRNYRRKTGEIDLIMRDMRSLVFVEVKYRSNENFTLASLTINAAKCRRISRAAAQYLSDSPQTIKEQNCRFDVVLLLGEPTAPRIEWIKDAFRLNDHQL
ncbi:MAG: YraN family protein [Candidatus Eutrophobiaceae bacterium]